MDDRMYEHVVMFSGGLCSFHAARRVLDAVDDRERVALLFCDTLIEHPDLYRFIDDAERALNHPVVRIAEGRTPWQVFEDEGMIGNTRADLCSRILKREFADEWVHENCIDKPTLSFGFDFTEANRLEDVRAAKPWATCEAPLLMRPYLWPAQMLEEAVRLNVEPSDTYAAGFTHDNCGGGCVKGGHAHWARLLAVRPAVYAEWEDAERRFRKRTGKNVAILRDRRGGKTKPMTLEAFRIRMETGAPLAASEREDEGGCNCFAPPREAA